MRSQRHIKVPAEYFRKAKDEYADWSSAWWREAIQNSLDAGANSLDISIGRREGGGAHVAFHDNGRGMSQDILLNTFLALGGSAKPDEAIGGFGYAKNLLCFAHKHYRILTGIQRIEGAGGDYEHWESEESEKVPGVRLEVELDEQRLDPLEFERSLETLLNASRLPKNLSIKVNGNVLTPRHPTFPFKTETSIGPLQFRDSGHTPSKLWVRVGGLAMFPVTIWTNDSHFQGIIDLVGNSVDLLTSNRDSLRGDKQSALQKIVQQLATERGALKCNDLLDLTLNFAPVIAHPIDSTYTPPEISADQNDGDDMTSEEEPVGAQSSASYSFMSEQQRAQAERLGSSKPKTLMRVPPQELSPEADAFKKLADKRQGALGKIQERLSQLDTTGFPTTFRIRTSQVGAESRRDPAAAYTPVLKKLSQDRIQKLARAWDATVKAVLSQPMARMGGVDWKDGKPFKDGRPINAGFVFSEQLEGLHVAHPDGAYDLLMNPDCMPKYDIDDMLDIAIHEVTHLWVSGHHEGFTNMELRLRRGFRKFMPLAELRKDVRAAIDSHQSKGTNGRQEELVAALPKEPRVGQALFPEPSKEQPAPPQAQVYVRPMNNDEMVRRSRAPF